MKKKEKENGPNTSPLAIIYNVMSRNLWNHNSKLIKFQKAVISFELGITSKY